MWYPRIPKYDRALRGSADLSLLALAFAGAHLLRFDFSISWLTLGLLPATLLTLSLELLLLGLTKSMDRLWRYFGLIDVFPLVLAMSGAAALLAFLRAVLSETLQPLRLPYSVIALNFVLSVGFLTFARILRRSAFERRSNTFGAPAASLLLVGAGTAGALVASQLRRQSPNLVLHGFLDDDPAKQGSRVAGLPVLGTTDDVVLLCERLDIRQVVVTMPGAPRIVLQRLTSACQKAGIVIRSMPSMSDLIRARAGVTEFSDIRMADLLDRSVSALDPTEAGGFLRDQVVLVTGAGGSIGSEVCRQIVELQPRRLLILDRSEPALFSIEQELGRLRPNLPLRAILADVRDRARVERLFAELAPSVVIHAAAHKHVPLLENHVCEAIDNNTIGTRTVAEIAGESGTKVFVLVSTDKAVRPTSVMGATKRLAESVLLAVDERFPGTRYAAVRFGNVLGSAGSVIPTFLAQIQRGGPVTVTHPEATRFFMTIPEAAQLILRAGLLGEGGNIFILDMGTPVRILDLAERLIVLSGKEVHSQVEIEFTGLRPGERLHEELVDTGERAVPTRFDKIMRLEPSDSWRAVWAELPALEPLVRSGDELAAKRLLGRLCGDFLS